MSDFEKWWATVDSDDPWEKEYAEKAWNARGEHDSKPQPPATCPKGHPRWALTYKSERPKNWNEPEVATCSICAEVAKVEAERDLLRKKTLEIRTPIGYTYA